MKPGNWLYSPRVAAGLIIVALGYMTALPGPSKATLDDLGQTIAFERTPLPETAPAGAQDYVLDFVEPLRRVDAYLSAFAPIGAVFADLDGDGLQDEICIADPLRRRTTVLPAPTKRRDRFSAFDLTPEPLLFEPKRMVPTGCLPGDFNEDGRADLLVYFWGRTPIIYLRRAASAERLPTAAAFEAVEAVAIPGVWYTSSIASGDIDGDGHLDLAVANYFADDSQVFSGGPVGGPIEMNDSYGISTNAAENRLLLKTARGDGTAPFRLASGGFAAQGGQWTTTVGVADLSGDQLPEVMFVNDHGPDRMLHNRSQKGAPAFVEVFGQRDALTPKSFVVGKDTFHGMGIDFGDLNRDGNVDIFVSNITGDFGLHESHYAWIHSGQNEAFLAGRAPFTQRSEEFGLSRSSWAWDARIVDLANDGRPGVIQSLGFLRGKVNRVPEMHEMALGNDFALRYPESWHRLGVDDDVLGQQANALFKWDAPHGRYENVGALAGLNEPGVSRGIAVADTDGDGRLELLFANQRAPATFLRNTARKSGRFLALDVRLAYAPADAGAVHRIPGIAAERAYVTSRPAVGATVKIGIAGGQKVATVIDGGNGGGGKRYGVAHFGLGDGAADEPINVAIDWRDINGQVHHADTAVVPGWHTLWLGKTGESEDGKRGR